MKLLSPIFNGFEYLKRAYPETIHNKISVPEVVYLILASFWSSQNEHFCLNGRYLIKKKKKYDENSNYWNEHFDYS